jgi:hypothetical protein
MSFHSFTPESYWDYHRSFVSGLRRQAEAKAEGKYGWDPGKFDSLRHNHPHFNGMYGMAQMYFYWFEGYPDGLTAEDGYYFLEGESRWFGFGSGRPNMPCWQFHCDDYREYIDWEWWTLREGWKDSRAKIHYRNRFQGNIPKPKEIEEEFPAIRSFMC